MDYDPERLTLRFASADQAAAFHAQLSALLREATIAVSGSTPDAEVATARVRELLAHYTEVTQALEAFREHLPRRPT